MKNFIISESTFYNIKNMKSKLIVTDIAKSISLIYVHKFGTVR